MEMDSKRLKESIMGPVVEAETRKSQAFFLDYSSLIRASDFIVEASTPSLISFLTHHLNHFDSQWASNAVQTAILFLHEAICTSKKKTN